MLDSVRDSWRRLSRRDLFHRGGLLGVPALLGGAPAAAAPARGELRAGTEVYQSIGVRPLINCRGTFTIHSGSLMLPEVRAAMDAAAQRFVHLDELADAVGARLAEITRAEWGMVSSGCAAGLTHTTAACVAGGNPDLHVRMPNLDGFAKDEVIIPAHSRNVYDAAVRAVGVRITEVSTPEELELAIGPRTAMIYLLAGPNMDKSNLPLDVIARIASPKNVPVLVDAAAEILTIPNVHLQKGATVVAYSGGKCIRGPQTAGVLLGRKDILQAAWVHSAPHHGFARGYKVGKEEAIGMLMAVEMWVKRDHEAEWKRWQSWLDHIAQKVSAVDGVTTSVRLPEGLSNRTPSLSISWDEKKKGFTARDIARHLDSTEPRIVVPLGRQGLSVTPYMMNAGEEKIVADRLVAVLNNPPKPAPPSTAAPATNISGSWDVTIRYAAGSSSRHVLHLRQENGKIDGSHQGDFVSRDLSGSIAGDEVQLSSNYSERHGDSLNFTFTGKVSGDAMSGSLDMGEYRKAEWRAERHRSRRA